MTLLVKKVFSFELPYRIHYPLRSLANDSTKKKDGGIET